VADLRASRLGHLRSPVYRALVARAIAVDRARPGVSSGSANISPEIVSEIAWKSKEGGAAAARNTPFSGEQKQEYIFRLWTSLGSMRIAYAPVARAGWTVPRVALPCRCWT